MLKRNRDSLAFVIARAILGQVDHVMRDPAAQHIKVLVGRLTLALVALVIQALGDRKIADPAAQHTQDQEGLDTVAQVARVLMPLVVRHTKDLVVHVIRVQEVLVILAQEAVLLVLPYASKLCPTIRIAWLRQCRPIDCSSPGCGK